MSLMRFNFSWERVAAVMKGINLASETDDISLNSISLADGSSTSSNRDINYYSSY